MTDPGMIASPDLTGSGLHTFFEHDLKGVSGSAHRNIKILC